MPKIVDHDQQRAELLDHAFRVFAAHGYAAATMRKLAKAAGVSTGTLYHYFPDKPAILVALFDHVTDADTARVRNDLPIDADLDARLATLFAFYRTHREHLHGLLRLALDVRRHEPDHPGVQAAVRRYRDSLADVLGVDGVVVALAFQILLGALTYELLDPGGVDLEAQEAFVRHAAARLMGEDG